MFETLNSFVLTILAVMAVVVYTGKEMQRCGILKVKRPTRVRRFRSAEAGQDLIEYALMAGFVCVAAGAILPNVIDDIKIVYHRIGVIMETTDVNFFSSEITATRIACAILAVLFLGLIVARRKNLDD